MDHIEYRNCSVCKEMDVVWKNGNFVLFHYSTRRYAHPACMVGKWGLIGSEEMLRHQWLIKLFRKALKGVRLNKMVSQVKKVWKTQDAVAK